MCNPGFNLPYCSGSLHQWLNFKLQIRPGMTSNLENDTKKQVTVISDTLSQSIRRNQVPRNFISWKNRTLKPLWVS